MGFHSRADELLRRILALRDDQLDGDFWWTRGDRRDDFSRRHGLYMLSELVLEAADGLTPTGGEAAALAAHVVRAAWDLRALLLPLDAEDVRREPRAGEWSMAGTMNHILASQEFWDILFELWVEQGRSGEPLAFRHAGEEISARRARGDEMVSEPEALISELDELVGRGCRCVAELEALGMLHEPEVGFNRGPLPVPAAYYPRRWAAHLREHTVQLEKTLAWLGRAPSEQERIARVTAEAIGDLEAAWWRAGCPAGIEASLAAAERHLGEVLQAS